MNILFATVKAHEIKKNLSSLERTLVKKVYTYVVHLLHTGRSHGVTEHGVDRPLLESIQFKHYL